MHHKIGLSVNLWCIFSFDDWWGKAQPIVGCATTGQVVPDGIRKQAEQDMENKPVVTLLYCLCINSFL